jgi:predicted transcriptional regulator
MADNWSGFRDSLVLTPEEEDIISLEKALISAIIKAREESGLTQNQLSELCGVKQPVISRLENALHSPQLNSIISILRPLGYRLAVIKDEPICMK